METRPTDGDYLPECKSKMMACCFNNKTNTLLLDFRKFQKNCWSFLYLLFVQYTGLNISLFQVNQSKLCTAHCTCVGATQIFCICNKDVPNVCQLPMCVCVLRLDSPLETRTHELTNAIAHTWMRIKETIPCFCV